jgi:uncharacterized membrane protein HdeD (DUF308 family)
MYFYNALAIILGLLGILVSFNYIFKPKNFEQRMNKLIFIRSFRLYCFLYATISIIIGIILISFGIIGYIKTIDYSNKDFIHILVYIISISIYLIFNILIDKIFIRKNNI